MFFTRGRIVRWAILLILGVVAIVICWHDPVYAGSSPAAAWAQAFPPALPPAVPHAVMRTLTHAADGTTVIDPAPQVRLADIDTPAAGRASVTALLIGAGLVALLFSAVTLVTFRRR
ncbi:hypothetical protein ACIA8K_04585 [Catenuloplanes sp. NPDC051500]|uniref:hypothetical protein n=1 Tax=Catenuloplanes sp. NPDC051500 TaxID=3363959 RepID=UPI0037B268E8